MMTKKKQTLHQLRVSDRFSLCVGPNGRYGDIAGQLKHLFHQPKSTIGRCTKYFRQWGLIGWKINDARVSLIPLHVVRCTVARSFISNFSCSSLFTLSLSLLFFLSTILLQANLATNRVLEHMDGKGPYRTQSGVSRFS